MLGIHLRGSARLHDTQMVKKNSCLPTCRSQSGTGNKANLTYESFVDRWKLGSISSWWFDLIRKLA